MTISGGGGVVFGPFPVCAIVSAEERNIVYLIQNSNINIHNNKNNNIAPSLL